MSDEGPLPELLEAIGKLGVKQLKAIIDAADLDRSTCVEKDDLRVLAVTAAAAGVPVPDYDPAAAAAAAAAAKAAATAAAPDPVPESAPPAAPEAPPPTQASSLPVPTGPPSAERAELEESWSETALRIQLELLGKLDPQQLAGASKAQLIGAYWAHLESEGSALSSEEYPRRWLRVDGLDKETQSRKFVEAVTGEPFPAEATLQECLMDGEALCDLINVLLAAKGQKQIVVSRGDPSNSNMSDRGAERSLGKGFARFARLNREAAADDGAAGGGETVASVDATEGLTAAQQAKKSGKASGQAASSRLRAKQLENISKSQAACLELGVAKSNTFDPEDLFEGRNIAAVVKNIHALAVVATKLVDYRGPQMGPIQRKERTWVQRASVVATDWNTLSSARAAAKRVAAAPLGGLSEEAAPADDEAPPELNPLEEVLADPSCWREKYAFVETGAMSEENASLAWVDAVLGKAHGEPSRAPKPLGEALRSGAALCRVLSLISRDAVKPQFCVENEKPFEQMAAIEAYLRGCTKLGVNQTFMTVDLHEGRDLRAVARQLSALALLARTRPECKAFFRGPHLGNDAHRKEAAEALAVREAALAKHEKKTGKEREAYEKKLERERKRIERDIRSEEIEAERRLIAHLQQMEEDTIAAKKKALTEKKQEANLAKEIQEARELEDASPAGYLYKRGGVAKLWRKRWFAIDGGELSYFATPEEQKLGKPPIGTLALANACIRRPTDPKSKGKYKSTCMRLDVDPEVQKTVSQRGALDSERSKGSSLRLFSTKSSKKAEVSADDDEDGGLSSATSKEKYKFLLAAESAAGMNNWMSAVEFWSVRKGSAARRSVINLQVTEEEAAALRKQAKTIPGLATKYLQEEPEEEEPEEVEEESEEEEDPAAAAARLAAEKLAELTIEGASPEKQELMGWSLTALRHQLTELSSRPGAPCAAPTEGLNRRELVERYWAALQKLGTANDEAVRRWLLLPRDADVETQAKLWIGCLLDVQVPSGPLQATLRSGEMLCEIINAIKPGMIAKLARADLLSAMSENRRNARMRENIGQYVDACAELGVPQRELFITADLFDDKNFKAVLKSIHGLARLAHYDVPGFVGPHMGIRKKGRIGGASGLLTGLQAAAQSTKETPALQLQMPGGISSTKL